MQDLQKELTARMGETKPAQIRLVSVRSRARKTSNVSVAVNFSEQLESKRAEG